MAIVRECTGHTRHSQHHVLWYFFRQPMTTVLLEFTYEFDIQEKACFSRPRAGEGSSIVPFKVGGTLVDSVHVASAVNQPYSPARLSLLQSEGAQHHCVTLIMCTNYSSLCLHSNYRHHGPRLGPTGYPTTEYSIGT